MFKKKDESEIDWTQYEYDRDAANRTLRDAMIQRLTRKGYSCCMHKGVLWAVDDVVVACHIEHSPRHLNQTWQRLIGKANRVCLVMGWMTFHNSVGHRMASLAQKRGVGVYTLDTVTQFIKCEVPSKFFASTFRMPCTKSVNVSYKRRRIPGG